MPAIVVLPDLGSWVWGRFTGTQTTLHTTLCYAGKPFVSWDASTCIWCHGYLYISNAISVLGKKKSCLLNQCLFLEFLISMLLACLARRRNYFLLNFSCRFPLFSLQRCFIYQSINLYILDQSTSYFCFNTSLAIRNDMKGKYNWIPALAAY